MSNNHNRVHLSYPQLQSSSARLPLDIEEGLEIMAPVVIRIRNTCTALVIDPSQSHMHGPPVHAPPEASSMCMHYPPVFNHSTPTSRGAGHALTALDRQQHPYDNIFAWEDWCHAELWAGNNTPLPVPNRLQLGNLGSRENSILIEDLPYAIPPPDRVPSPFIHTVPSANTPATGIPTLPLASPENSVTLPVYYLPSCEYLSTSLEYFSDILNPPVISQDTSSLSFITPNPPIPCLAPSTFPGFCIIGTECICGSHSTLGNSSTPITPSSPTLLIPRPNHRYNYSAPSATSPDPATSSLPCGIDIDPPHTSLGSTDIQQLLAPSESVLSELGYYTSTSHITMDSNEEGEGMSDNEDMNQQAKPQESLDIILTWREVRVDTGSGQEEEVVTQG